MNKRTKYIIGFIALYVLWFFTWNSKDSHAISCAKSMVEEYLKAPTTASFFKTEVVGNKENFYVVYVVVDAENSFGAKVRGSYLAAMKIEFHGLERLYGSCSYNYNTVLGVKEIYGLPSKDEISAMISVLND
jgi:hypothetical protein